MISTIGSWWYLIDPGLVVLVCGGLELTASDYNPSVDRVEGGVAGTRCKAFCTTVLATGFGLAGLEQAAWDARTLLWLCLLIPVKE